MKRVTNVLNLFFRNVFILIVGLALVDSCNKEKTIPPCSISSFSPAGGQVGTLITITGNNFSPSPSDNKVKFNGILANVTSSTISSIKVIVPPGASTGKISITIGSNTILSSSDYVVAVEAVKSGGVDFDESETIAIDYSGNQFIAGRFRGTTDFGGKSLIASGSDDNMFVAKYNSSCDLLWASKAGGSGSSVVVSIAVDVAGNAYVTGSFSGTLILGPTTLICNGGGADVFVAKFNPSGNAVWAKQIGSVDPSSEIGTCLKLDDLNNLFVVGYFRNTVTIGANTLTAAGEDDVFVVKYNSETGEAIWAKRFGGLDSDSVSGLALSSSGNIYISGSFLGTTTFGSLSFSSIDMTDAYLAKLNSNGEVIWAKHIEGPSYGGAHSIALDDSDNCYVAGYFTSAVSFGTTSLIGFGNEDIYLAKYNSYGDLIWVKSAGGNDYEEAASLSLDVTGNAYITGYFARTAKFGNKFLTSDNLSPDIFVSKFSPSGIFYGQNKQVGQTMTTEYQLRLINQE